MTEDKNVNNFYLKDNPPCKIEMTEDDMLFELSYSRVRYPDKEYPKDDVRKTLKQLNLLNDHDDRN